MYLRISLCKMTSTETIYNGANRSMKQVHALCPCIYLGLQANPNSLNWALGWSNTTTNCQFRLLKGSLHAQPWTLMSTLNPIPCTQKYRTKEHPPDYWPGCFCRGLGRLVTQVCGHIKTLHGCRVPSRKRCLVSEIWIPPSGAFGKVLAGTKARQ